MTSERTLDWYESYIELFDTGLSNAKSESETLFWLSAVALLKEVCATGDVK
jgi:hypothetical protein